MDKIILSLIAILIVLIILYGFLFMWQNQKVLAPDSNTAIPSTNLLQQ